MFAAGSKVLPTPISDTFNAEPMCTWKEIIDPIEPFLEAVSQRLAKQVDAFDPDIAPYADHALNGQGKHLRPSLVALTANALGKVSDSHVTVAVIIEMVHLATLVHDDGRLPLRPGLETGRRFSYAGGLPRRGYGDQHRLLR